MQRKISNSRVGNRSIIKRQFLQTSTSVLACGFDSVWFGLVWFYDVSTIIGYLAPNSFLYIETVLF